MRVSQKIYINKKIIPHQRHVKDSDDSLGLGGNPEESMFYKDRIQKKIFTGGKTKSAPYYRGVKHY